MIFRLLQMWICDKRRLGPILLLPVLVCGLLPPCSAADSQEPDEILIKNVLLIDFDGEAPDQVVSILIKKGRLDLLTSDPVTEREGMLLLDAGGLVLLGDLDIGQRSDFLILDQDPRQDFNILLDTKEHVVFAFHNGTIVRNNLTQVAVDPTPRKKRKWFAYTPPPRSLPLSYRDSTKWNRWDSEYVSGMFFGALVIDRQYWLSQDDASEQQVGDLKLYEAGEIRGSRVGVVGALKFERPWIYTVFVGTQAFDRGFDARQGSSLTLYDLRLDVPLTTTMSLAVGQQKEPISMERLMPLVYMPMQERSAAMDAMLRARNVGVVLSGTGSNRRVTWAGGVFNDWFDGGRSFGESSTQLVGRATWIPFLATDDSNLLHLGLAVRYTNARSGLQYRSLPEFNLAPVFADTGGLQPDFAVTYAPEASWRMGPVWVLGEALISKVRAPDSGNPLFHGYYLTGSWSLTGEMRPYNRRSGVFGPLPVARPVTRGGWGAWELGARWSNLDLAERSVGGGELGVFSFGLNWWPVQAAMVSATYRSALLDRFDLQGNSNGLALRLVLILD
jgi:phosphate-selective porin OprO/OprP